MKPRWIAVALIGAGFLKAQAPAGSQKPEQKMEFDVASVKENKSDAPSISNFPLGPGAVYVPNGGLLSATGFPLITYIAFAYKLSGNDARNLPSQLPGWVMTDKFDIQARAAGNPTKDEMRLLMRSLLADRFKLTSHYDTKEVPALAATLAKPDKTGPQLQPHAGDAPCPTEAPVASASAPTPNLALASGLPALCGGIFGMPSSAPGRVRAAARNVTMELMTGFLTSADNLGRPVVDHTGLKGTFDFSLEWAPEPSGPVPAGADLDQSGPTFVSALKEQLGLKLDSTKSPVQVFVVDHVERPSGN